MLCCQPLTLLGLGGFGACITTDVACNEGAMETRKNRAGDRYMLLQALLCCPEQLAWPAVLAGIASAGEVDITGFDLSWRAFCRHPEYFGRGVTF